MPQKRKADSAEATPIFVRTLGAFSLTPARSFDEALCDSAINIAGRAHRVWLLIAYLVVHKDREVPANEIFDMLWGEEDQGHENPRKTLQHTISRARDMLARHGLPHARELIVSTPDGYRWNPQVETYIDLELFQEAASKASSAESADKRIALHERCLSLYRGDFLPGFEAENWVTPISAYGRSLYVNQCLALTRLLSGEDNVTKIASVCERALRYAPESEELTLRYIRALTASSCPEKAIAVFDNTRKLLLDKLGIAPSVEMELAYEEARQSLDGEIVPIDTLRRILSEEATSKTGMSCNWSSFLTLVHREARNAARSSQDAAILSVSFDDVGDCALQARCIESVVAQRLRNVDVYTRLNAKQFLILLPEVGKQNMDKVVKRLENALEQQFPKLAARVHCSWYCLEEPLDAIS